MISSQARFAVIALLLAGAGLFVHTRARNHLLPGGKTLSSIPLQIADWAGTDIPFLPQTLAVLGSGEFVQRVYDNQSTKEPHVELYLAHRPRSSRYSLESHLPTECLLGSGWSLADSKTITQSLAGRPSIVANRYLIVRGSDRQLVMFWFWAHGRNVASTDSADFYLTLDSLRFNRNDYVLVRINTPLGPGEEADDAQRRLFSFAAQLVPLLDNSMSR